MKAVQIVEPGRVRVVEREMPALESGSVLLKMRAFGLCGSDLNTYRGANPLVSYPRIPGHELCGQIEKLPRGYGGPLAVGEIVTVMPYRECGRCSACRAGRPNCCRSNETLGVQRDGGATEYLAVPADKLLSAAGLLDEQVASVEPLSVGFHAASRAQIEPEEIVLVFGCGMIGLGAICAAAYQGARVIAVDVDEGKLDKARRLGAEFGINSVATDLAGSVSDITGGDGPVAVIEAVGRPETYAAAVDLVAYAGRVVYIGYASKPVTYETKSFVTKELDIRGSRNAALANFREVIAMLRSSAVDIDALITHRYRFDETGDALAYWRSHPEVVTKIHVTV